MSAKDIPVAMRPEEERAWEYVVRNKIEKGLELAPSSWEFILEMGREYIRLGDENIILEKFPDSAIASAIRELQAMGYNPEEEE